MNNLISLRRIFFPTEEELAEDFQHRLTTQIFLDSNDYLYIAQYCMDCGKVFSKRRIKTEPVEEGGDAE